MLTSLLNPLVWSREFPPATPELHNFWRGRLLHVFTSHRTHGHTRVIHAVIQPNGSSGTRLRLAEGQHKGCFVWVTVADSCILPFRLWTTIISLTEYNVTEAFLSGAAGRNFLNLSALNPGWTNGVRCRRFPPHLVQELQLRNVDGLNMIITIWKLQSTPRSCQSVRNNS